VEHKQRTYSGGWTPDVDAAGAPPEALLRCDNLLLDELGVLSLRLGSTKINPGAPLSNTDVHSLFTVNRSGTKIRYAAAGSLIYRNAVTDLGLTMAGSGDVAFGSHLGQTFFARSTTKYKDDGTTVRNWGIAMTGGVPEVLAPIESDTKEYASWDATETADHEINENNGDALDYGESHDGIADGAIVLFPNPDTGRLVVTRNFSVPQDVTELDGGREATDDDIISFYMYVSNPQTIIKTQLQMDVNGGDFQTDFYLKEWKGEGLPGPDGSVPNPGQEGPIDSPPGEAPLI
jgi:hypothetical protein